jgi:excinuclease ABC subunit C
VDGGKGQLGIAAAVLNELEIKNQPIAGIAKERNVSNSAETDRIFLPGRKNPIAIKSETSALYILAAARDEAHRLANSFSAKLKRKESFKSELDNISGIGEKTKKTLLKELGSLKKIKNATREELIKVPGIGPKLAEAILKELNTHNN